MALVPQYIKELEPYKPGRPIEEIQKLYGIEKVIKLASNENPLGVSPMAVQAMRCTAEAVNRYPDISSMMLRTKLSEFYNLKMQEIITGHGSEAIMQVALRTFVHGDDEVITSDGTFVGFYVMAKAMGIKLKIVPMNNYHFDLKAIAASITKKTKLIYLVNPNSPTGTIYTKTEFEEFLKVIPTEILILVDEAYVEFVQDDKCFPNSLDYMRPNVISLRTFSKAHGLAGIRLGYGFANEELITYMHKVRLPFEPGILSQAAGVAALDDKKFLDEYMKLNNSGKEFLYDVYDKLGIKYIKTHTNFIISIFETEDKVNDIAEKLLRKGVIIRPLKAFRLPHCIRVTIGLPEENEIYTKALKEVL